jgi:tetratricopeptide (TPR) repeat protein
MQPGGSAVDLSRTLLADEIGRVRRERWSGVLALTQGDVSKGLYFVQGEIAFAASTLEEDRLGSNLYRAGRITEAQFRTAMRPAEGQPQPLGRALVEAGVLTEPELATAVNAQVERIVLSVLRWSSGELRRRPMDRPIPEDLALDLDTRRLLLLGLRQYPDVARLERALGDAERLLRRVMPAPFDTESLPLTPAERAILALARRPTALRQLLGLPLPRPELVRAVTGLTAAGLLDEVLSPAAPPPVEAEPASSQVATQAAEPEPVVPWTTEAAVRAAGELLEQGSRERALDLLRECVRRAPEAPDARRLLALTLAQDAGFDADVELQFRLALEQAPADSALRYALASYYRRAGMTTRALLHLRLVLSADPEHAAAWRDLGELEAAQARRR